MDRINPNKLSICVISENDLLESGCFNIPEAIEIAEDSFRKMISKNVIVPDKVSVIFDEQTQNRINCLPAGSYDDNVYGMKWVSVFPDNPQKFGLQNVSAIILLSNMTNGFPKALMAGTLCSNLRTAATSAVAAKYLARKDSKVIGFIGAGAQAKSHFMALKSVCPLIKICKVSSRTGESEQKFIDQMTRLYDDVEFIPCRGKYEDAITNSDIIVTAISGQEKILKAEWIKRGAFYCHVAGLEDEYDVALKADKIVCDDWEMVKHRTQTISQMHKAGLLNDKDIYANLSDIITNKVVGREAESEFIYFNTVGSSLLDVMLANHMFKKVKAKGLGQTVLLQEESMFDVDTHLILR